MERELSTIQKREKLNKVIAVGESDVANAISEYEIIRDFLPSEKLVKECVGRIQFQRGSRKDFYSTSGVTNEDLLEIVRDRLIGFQNGNFPCRENACALTHIEEALMWLNKRVEDRIERNVLGKNVK